MGPRQSKVGSTCLTGAKLLCYAEATPGIEEVDVGALPPTRDTWLGYHRDMKRQPRLRALLDLVIERLAPHT